MQDPPPAACRANAIIFLRHSMIVPGGLLFYKFYRIKKVHQNGLDRLLSNPLIVRFAVGNYRSGWHLPKKGVAVTSQILCISITLNKGISSHMNFSYNLYIHHFHPCVKHYFCFFALRIFSSSSST